MTIQRQRATETCEDVRQKLVPLYRVIIWNDSIHTTVEVVEILMRVFRFDVARAEAVMLEAHKTGAAACVTTYLELAEMYCCRLRGHNLTASIEPA